MKLKESLVSIVLPVYNAGKFLSPCLKSLISQTYAPLEIIAVDDHSKDNSLRILKEFKKKSKKIRIEIIQNKKRYGPALCCNRALRMAQGQFISFMNAADTVALYKLKRQVNYLNANPKNVAIGSQFVTVDTNNKCLKKSSLPQEHEEIYHTLLPSVSLKPETLLINRMLFPKDLLHFATNKYPYIFSEVLIKLIQYGRIANLNQCLYFQRTGIRRSARQNNSKLKQAFSFLQLLLKSRSVYDYRPSLKLLFQPLVKGI